MSALPPDTLKSLVVLDDQRRGEDPESLTFLADRIDAMSEEARPSDAERADLDRRLKSELWPINDADWIVVIEALPDGGRRVYASPRTAAMKRVWPAVFYDWQRSRDLAGIATRERLKQEKAQGDTKASEHHAEGVLRAAVARRLDALLDVGGREPNNETGERVAAWLAEHGLPGGAASVRASAWNAEKWADPLHSARVLALSVWTEELRDSLSRASVPGMNLMVVGDLARVRAAQGMLPLAGAGGWTITDKDGNRIGELGPSIDGRLVRPDVLQNVATQMLVRVMLSLTHQQRITGSQWNRPDAACSNTDKVLIEGGRARLAKLMGMKESKGTEVWEAVEALSAVRLRLQGMGEGQLLAYWKHEKAHRNQKSVVELALMGPLGSNYVHELDPRKHDRRIVPVPVPLRLFPFVGGRNEWGGQLMLQLLLVMLKQC